VLIVSSDGGIRSQLSAWLEHDGYEVMSCPGPRTPRTLCVGLRGSRCALDTGADLVLLDIHPAGDDFVDRTTRAGLVDLYRARNRSVMVLADELAGDIQAPLNGAAVISRMADREAVLGAVRELLSRQAARGKPGPDFPMQLSELGPSGRHPAALSINRKETD
jgi:hypothetical protein